MIRRRTVLASSIAVPVAAQAASLGAHIAGGDVPKPRYCVIAERFSAAAQPVVAAGGADAYVLSFESDLTPVYDVLDRHLAIESFTIAGLTSSNDLFVLERLGLDRGLKTVVRDAESEQVFTALHASDWQAKDIPLSQDPPARGGFRPVAWLMVPR